MTPPILLDSILPLIQAPLDSLCHSIMPRAMYARGSIVTSGLLHAYQPWDMDFVIFVDSKSQKLMDKVEIFKIELMTNFNYLPPPDIKVCTDELSDPDTIYSLLLLSVQGRLLFGEDIRRPFSFFVMHGDRLWQDGLHASQNRLQAFLACVNPAERKQRAPHLAKSVLRLGGLLSVTQGLFTRDPTECACLLAQMYPAAHEDIRLLLRCVGGVIELDILGDACKRVLGLTNEYGTY